VHLAAKANTPQAIITRNLSSSTTLSTCAEKVAVENGDVQTYVEKEKKRAANHLRMSFSHQWLYDLN